MDEKNTVLQQFVLFFLILFTSTSKERWHEKENRLWEGGKGWRKKTAIITLHGAVVNAARKHYL